MQEEAGRESPNSRPQLTQHKSELVGSSVLSRNLHSVHGHQALFQQVKMSIPNTSKGSWRGHSCPDHVLPEPQHSELINTRRWGPREADSWELLCRSDYGRLRDLGVSCEPRAHAPMFYQVHRQI